MIISRVVGDRPLDLTSADDRSENDPYPEMIKEVDRELTKMIGDFDRGMNCEALRKANETGTLSFSQSVNC